MTDKTFISVKSAKKTKTKKVYLVNLHDRRMNFMCTQAVFDSFEAASAFVAEQPWMNFKYSVMEYEMNKPFTGVKA